MAPLDVARGYHADVTAVSVRAARLMLRLWNRGVRRDDISGSWLAQLPHAVALLIGAQTVAAELADPYLDEIAPGAAAGEIAADAFAGATLTGEPVSSLLYRPVVDAKQAIANGANVSSALLNAQAPLAMYTRSETTDAARQAVSAGMGARPDVTGYYRMLVPPSCSRCAILAGRRYSKEVAFDRHPRCDCVHIPAREVLDDVALDVRASIEAGNVTGLSKAERKAIELGADPAQIVNAHRGMYTTADGRYRYTREGTTRRGVAGARILARDAARARGEDVTGRLFDNLVFSKEEAAAYADLLRSGVKHTRLTKKGRQQSYSYRHARTPRPTAEQIMRDARSEDDAIRLLVNNGYIIDTKALVARGPSFTQRVEQAQAGDAARKAAPLSLLRPSEVRRRGALTPDEAFALSTYKGSGYSRVNPWMREGRDASRPDLAREAAQIDAAMARSPLADDVVVHRGIVDPELVFGDAARVNLAGAQWRELAYVSTSTAEGPARNFALFAAGGEAAVMRILVPKGTGAVELSNGDYEAELLLQAGLRMRVVSDSGPGTRPRLLDVEVLP